MSYYVKCLPGRNDLLFSQTPIIEVPSGIYFGKLISAEIQSAAKTGYEFFILE